ncbi:MAG: lipoprotein-releasing ABC transporter permease subunit [Thermodesulfobacteriota bacterium]
MSVETFIGWRYLKAKRKQTFISLISIFSLLGIALGVMTLIVVLAVMTGTEEEIRKRILGVNSHILVMRYGQQMVRYQELVERVAALDGVLSVEPFVYSQVIMSGRGGVSGAVFRGLDPGRAARSGGMAQFLEAGRLDELTAGEEPGIILGSKLAENLNVGPGHLVRVVSPQGRLTQEGERAPKVRHFKVVGLVKSGMEDFDTVLAYVSLAEAQDFLGIGDGVTGLEVRVADIYQAPEIKKAILERLGATYWARDWTEMNRSLFAALKIQKTAMFIIISLTVLVAAFNIVSTLIMVVMEKTKDIAILMSMGATGSTIMKIFIFQGLLIGVLGTLSGFFGGVLVCGILQNYQIIELPPDVYYLSTLPARLEFFDMVLVTASAVFISFLATLYPAWQASRLSPVEVLRYE